MATVRRVSAAVAIIVAACALAWWWTHPSLFRDVGAGVEMEPRPVSGAVAHTSVIFPPVEGAGTEVRLTGARAHFADNEAGAVASFRVCQTKDMPLGMVGGSLRDHCTALHDLPTDFRYAPESGQTLVMTISPTRGGRAEVDGVELDYARGPERLWQRGRQEIRVDVAIEAR